MSNYDKAVDQAQAAGAIKVGVEHRIAPGIYSGPEPFVSHFFNADDLEVATFYHGLADTDPLQTKIQNPLLTWRPEALARLDLKIIQPQSVREFNKVQAQAIALGAIKVGYSHVRNEHELKLDVYSAHFFNAAGLEVCSYIPGMSFDGNVPFTKFNPGRVWGMDNLSQLMIRELPQELPELDVVSRPKP